MKCPRCLVIGGLGALKAARGARYLIFRAQNELWRAQNRRKTSPKELLASGFEALEVSGTPRGDPESVKEARAAPKEPPGSFLRAKVMFKVA